MFGFLKNKLKEAINKFSKKAEEEAEVEETIKEEPKIKEIEVKQEGKGFLGLFKKKKVTEAEEIKETTEIKIEHKSPEKEKVIEQKIEVKQPVEEKKGFFSKLTEKITTKKISEEKFNELFEDLELALLENNVAVEVIDKIKEDLKVDLIDVPLKGKINELIKNSLKESLEDVLKESDFDLINEIKNKKEKPYVIVFVGINGSGKTSTVAKIAKLCQDNKISVVLGAADSFRKGSIEQLEEWGKRLNVKVVKNKYGSDPASICFDTILHAKSNAIDVVLIDTAGRQHSNKNLMEEMKKIIRVAKPDLKIFIGESIAGNDVCEQVKEFNNSINIDSIILAKADVDEKGGAAISVSYVSGKPILYIGTGQNYGDLEKFSKEKIVENIL